MSTAAGVQDEYEDDTLRQVAHGEVRSMGDTGTGAEQLNRCRIVRLRK